MNVSKFFFYPHINVTFNTYVTKCFRKAKCFVFLNDLFCLKQNYC